MYLSAFHNTRKKVTGFLFNMLAKRKCKVDKVAEPSQLAKRKCKKDLQTTNEDLKEDEVDSKHLGPVV